MTQASFDETPDDLDDVRSDIWKRLGRAAKDRRSAMHTPVVATIGADGAPNQRVMVLRAFDPAQCLLRFHTDSRAAKVADLAKGAAVSVLFYDAQAKRQFRLTGTAWTETDTALADHAWSASTLFARRCYLADPAPGTVSAMPVSGLAADIEGRVPADEAEVAAARENFAILLARIERIEFLHLAHTGHRRAMFHAGPEGAWTGQWLVP
jgi:pyridoxine/pyridoxamine 5'-phosphate oxidase